MAPLSFHDRQHLQKVLAQQQNITVVFNRFINAVSPHLRKWADSGKGSVWSRNGAVESVIDRELIKLQAELTNNLSSFQMDAWKRSELKNDQMIREYIEGMSIRSQAKEGLFARNTEGMKALQGRIDSDMNLSTRVWNLADQTKTQLEFYLGSGISIGQSAVNISQDIRQILNNPDARFHRVRNAEGKLVESKPMMNYNPGPGVYKSAYKNALRVAVTETNMAYRKADHERWKKLDFVLGFEVKRSGNNKGGCAICDAMCGTYPKEFSFTGWHPFCICLASPILMNHDEFAEYLLNDTIPMNRYITEMPPKAVKCMEQYKYSFMRSPYDMKQNYKILGDGKQIEKDARVPETTKVNGKTKFKTDEQKSAIREAWEERKKMNLFTQEAKKYIISEKNNSNKPVCRFVEERQNVRLASSPQVFGKELKSWIRDIDVYENRAGIVFIAPKNISKSKQYFKIADVISEFDKLPVELKCTIKEVNLLDFRNPRDAYWAKQYRMPNFRSFATGGNGTINFYANEIHQAAEKELAHTLIHEAGHNLDQKLKKISETHEWLNARDTDFKLGSGVSVSNYGKVHIHEDFAESVAMFVSNPEKLKKEFPSRYEILKKIIR